MNESVRIESWLLEQAANVLWEVANFAIDVQSVTEAASTLSQHGDNRVAENLLELLQSRAARIEELGMGNLAGILDDTLIKQHQHSRVHTSIRINL